MQRKKKAAPACGASPRVLRCLGELGGGIHAIIDPARERGLLQLASRAGAAAVALLEDGQAARAGGYGPILLHRPPKELLSDLVDRAWGRSALTLLTSNAAEDHLLRHLRRLTSARFDGRQLHFRLYDPRVGRVFLRALTPEQHPTLFDAIDAWLVEDDDPSRLIVFRRSDARVIETTGRLDW